VTTLLAAAAQSESLPQALRVFLALGTFWWCVIVGFRILWIYAFCRIASRVGRHWSWGLLTLIPAGEVLVVLILAFGACPKECKTSRDKKGT